MSFSHLILSLTLLSPIFTTAHKCSYEFSKEIKKIIQTQNCNKKTLGAEFGWAFDTQTRQLDIVLGAKLRSDAGWLAWGLNPYGPHMVGTRALIGIRHPDGSLERDQYNITEATKRGCQLQPSDDVGLNVSRFTFEYWEKIQYYAIQATLFLPHEYNSSRANVVWQVGEAPDGSPAKHPERLENLNSAETLDFVSGDIATYTEHLRRRLRLAHGILNMVGWGLLLPIGVIVARYFRIHPKRWQRWFTFHVICQSAGYIIGSAGWALGIWLGKTSKYYTFHVHQTLGIIIFTFTTIQMLALGLRPKPNDEYRTYWNMYHHSLGYALLALIWVNTFVGFRILEPDHVWKWSYVGVLGVLGAVYIAFEVLSWIKFFLKGN